MKKNIILFIIGILFIATSYAQSVGINNDGTPPNVSAMLDVKNPTKGLLVPRVLLSATTNPAPITTPAVSLLVYNTATVADVTPGYYYWSGSAWLRLATGSISSTREYAYIYNLTPKIVPIEADITFDTNGPLTSGITHAPGSSGITILNSGIYKVNFSVSAVEPNQVAIFRNGSPVPSALYGSGNVAQQNNGQVILSLSAGDVLTLRNHSSAAAFSLQPLAGGTQNNVNASVIIEKLN